MDILEKVVQIFEKELEEQLNCTISNIKEEDNLVDYGMDSLNIIKVILAIEEEYNIEFEEEELNFENFTSFLSIKNLIEKKL